ncbi:MAG: hypothetical protein GDA56_00855 [Hormoscilla sp. GM7CHS1pb]|nr:hypothetical protein [Hormoscilla sp. GM7CHS1pb]
MPVSAGDKQAIGIVTLASGMKGYDTVTAIPRPTASWGDRRRGQAPVICCSGGMKGASTVTALGPPT